MGHILGITASVFFFFCVCVCVCVCLLSVFKTFVTIRISGILGIELGLPVSYLAGDLRQFA